MAASAKLHRWNSEHCELQIRAAHDPGAALEDHSADAAPQLDVRDTIISTSLEHDGCKKGRKAAMSMFYDITKMSDNGLRAMQRAIRDRLLEEDELPEGQEKVYGLRQFNDWKIQADEIESELDRRGACYDKIPW
jgi:hypothetical protein